MKRKLKPFTEMGATLIQYIEGHGMNMRDFAYKAGVPYSSVNQWVVGHPVHKGGKTVRLPSYPNFRQILKLHAAFPFLLDALVKGAR